MGKIAATVIYTDEDGVGKVQRERGERIYGLPAEGLKEDSSRLLAYPRTHN